MTVIDLDKAGQYSCSQTQPALIGKAQDKTVRLKSLANILNTKLEGDCFLFHGCEFVRILSLPLDCRDGDKNQESLGLVVSSLRVCS